MHRNHEPIGPHQTTLAFFAQIHQPPNLSHVIFNFSLPIVQHTNPSAFSKQLRLVAQSHPKTVRSSGNLMPNLIMPDQFIKWPSISEFHLPPYLPLNGVSL